MKVLQDDFSHGVLHLKEKDKMYMSLIENSGFLSSITGSQVYSVTTTSYVHNGDPISKKNLTLHVLL